MPALITYAGYVWFPIAATVVWLATLLGLLLWWAVEDDARRYQRGEATVVFISDSGAAHKALFIPGTALTWLFYALSLLSERWLRHVDRIPGTIRSAERNWDIAAVVFGIIGGGALLFLSIFDAFNHSTPHWILTVVFIVCVAISAICQTIEIYYLKAGHPDRNHLARNAIIKVVVVTIAIILAIAFAICYGICSGSAGPGHAPKCDAVTSAAGVLEWTIAFLFDIYLATFILDLWPAAKTSPRYLRRQERRSQKEGGEKGLLGLPGSGEEVTRPSGDVSRHGSDPATPQMSQVQH